MPLFTDIPMNRNVPPMVTTSDRDKQGSSKHRGIGQWLIYMKSDEYKSLQPETISITESQLAAHNKPTDMWMALKLENKHCVYDVSNFADYHPGGRELLEQYAGMDATEAFRMAHAYINVDMIGNLRKGYLVRDKPGRFAMPNQLSPSMITVNPNKSARRNPKWNWITLSNGNIELCITFPQLCASLDQLRVVVLWNSSANQSPFNLDTNRLLILRTLLDHQTYHRIEWILDSKLTPILSNLQLLPTESGDSTDLKLELARSTVADSTDKDSGVCTIGCVSLDELVSIYSGQEEESPLSRCIIRPYTPVDDIYSSMDSQPDETLYFLIKVYPNATMSPMLDKLCPGDTIEVSLPTGHICPSLFASPGFSALFMVAGGSGITPMLRVIKHFLSVASMQRIKLCLIWFNRSQPDSAVASYLQRLSLHEKDRLFVHYVVSEDVALGSDCSTSIRVEHGSVSDTTLRIGLFQPLDITDATAVGCKAQWLICGPHGFNRTVLQITRTWNIPEQCILLFKS